MSDRLKFPAQASSDSQSSEAMSVELELARKLSPKQRRERSPLVSLFFSVRMPLLLSYASVASYCAKVKALSPSLASSTGTHQPFHRGRPNECLGTNGCGDTMSLSREE